MFLKPNQILTIVLPLALAGFCLVSGAWKALFERGQGEYGIESTPDDKWSYLWICIAVAIVLGAVVLAARRSSQK